MLCWLGVCAWRVRDDGLDALERGSDIRKDGTRDVGVKWVFARSSGGARTKETGVPDAILASHQGWLFVFLLAVLSVVQLL